MRAKSNCFRDKTNILECSTAEGVLELLKYGSVSLRIRKRLRGKRLATRLVLRLATRLLLRLATRFFLPSTCNYTLCWQDLWRDLWYDFCHDLRQDFSYYLQHDLCWRDLLGMGLWTRFATRLVMRLAAQPPSWIIQQLVTWDLTRLLLRLKVPTTWNYRATFIKFG